MSDPTPVDTPHEEPHGALLRATAKPCEVHPRHIPASYVNEVHHIWPLGHKGPNVAANRVVVCATGHNNIHKLLAMLLKNNGRFPSETTGRYTQSERRYALLGYDRIQRQSL